MSYLVHPLGWRLYFSKYWKINFFSSKRAFLILFFKTKLIFEIVLSILNKYYLLNQKRDILRFSTFKIFLNSSFLFVLIQYKLYWKNIFFEFDFLNYKKNLYLRRNYFISFKKKKNYLINNFKRNHISLLYRFDEEEEEDNFSFILTHEFSKYYKFFFKKIFFFFFFLPQLMFLKDFLINTLNKVDSISMKKIFFLGLNQKTFNINDVLNLIEILLRLKLKANFILYRIIKILKFYKKKQKLKGFKFLLAGRFSRRDRATFLWRTFGAVSLGSRLSVIEYYTRPVILQYSKCIAKIWLCRR